MTNKHKFFVMGAVLATFALSSCVDDAYDLSNIDMTLGTNVDLTLPGCSTGEIQLKNIIDLEEDGVVQLVANPKGGDDMYVVCQDGSADIDPINIGAINVKKPTMNDFYSTVNLKDLLAGNARPKLARRSAPLIINVGGIVIDLSENATYNYGLKEEDAKTDIRDAVASNVSSDVCSLTKVSCTPNSITLDLSVSGIRDHFGNLHLDDFKLTLPQELAITSVTIDGAPIASLKDMDSNPATQTLQLTPKTDVEGHSLHEHIILVVAFDGADIFTATKENPATAANNVVFTADKHEVAFSGSISVTGNFRVEVGEMDQEKLTELLEAEVTKMTPDQLNQFLGNPDLSQFSSILPESLTFSGANNFANSIEITHVSGEFKHDVGAIDPIKLDDLPDFLNDDEVVLDLDNPMIFISTSTTLPAKANTAIQLISRDGSNTVERYADNIVIEGSKVFWMANREEKVFVPKQYDGQNLIWTPLSGDVTALVKKIPDEIEVKVNEVRLSATDLDITKSYDVDVDYQFYAPLAFSDEFKLVYQDTEDGLDLGDDLDDVQFASDAVIEMTADVVSTLPTNCTLSLIPMGKQNNQLNNLETINLSVNAGTTTPIKVNITPTAGHTLNDALHSGTNQLDGIKYKAVLDDPKKGEVLTGEGSIVLKNVKLHVKTGVTYDAN